MKNKMSLPTKIFIGMFLGFLFGLVVGTPIVPFLKPVGDIFIRLISMLVVPLVFCTITAGVAGMTDVKKMGRLGVKIALFYVFTSVAATLIGLGTASLLKPGVGFVMESNNISTQREVLPLVDNIINMVPKNIFTAFTNMEMVQIIVFSILLGSSLVLLGNAKRPVLEFLESFSKAMTTMTNIVMKTAPIGVFALMGVTGAQYGLDVLLPLGKFFATEYVAMILQILLVYFSVLVLIGRVNPIKFIKKALPIMGMTLSTTSSNATLPLTMKITEEEMGVPKEVGGFTLPLGATVNLDGTALNIPIIILFTAQIFGINFTPAEMFTLLFSAIVISVGAAGIPCGLTPFVIALLAQFNLPTAAFGMILASYRLLDMGLTTTNVVGDTVCSVALSNSEGLLDRSKWISTDDAINNNLS